MCTLLFHYHPWNHSSFTIFLELYQDFIYLALFFTASTWNKGPVHAREVFFHQVTSNSPFLHPYFCNLQQLLHPHFCNLQQLLLSSCYIAAQNYRLFIDPFLWKEQLRSVQSLKAGSTSPIFLVLYLLLSQSVLSVAMLPLPGHLSLYLSMPRSDWPCWVSIGPVLFPKLWRHLHLMIYSLRQWYDVA